jgi:capsular exopolysaccharide synthesis family protein
MSRIFDAVQRGGDDLTHTVISALEDTAQDGAGSKLDAQALVDAALQNLAVPEAPFLPASIAVPIKAPHGLPSSAVKLVKPKPASPSKADARTVSLKVTGHSPLLPFDTANWRASEQYRTVRTRILQDARQPRTIAVSSAGAGDGKSVTAINIAGALSLKAEADVVLIDADFRRSSVHAQLSVPLSPGLTDILLDRCTFEGALIRAEQFPNFYILPAGTHVENPSDLLETTRWTKLREQISDMFQFTILDCPPVGAVSEWDLLQAACDGIIFVGRQDHTKIQEFLDALKSLPAEKLVGVILNCVSDWLLGKPYSSYEYQPQPPKRK